MIKKQIQKHDFLNGGPVLQYEIPFHTNILNGDYITIDNSNTMGYATINIQPHTALHNHQGDNIFRVDENRITYYDHDLVTENRLREIVQEIVDEYLGRE